MDPDAAKRLGAPPSGGCVVTIGDIAPTVLAELKPPKPPAPAPAAKPPTPTGVKPRGLLMPTLALLIMIIPLIALCLPVYLTSAKQREAERDSQAFVCQLYTQNNPSPRASEALDTFTFPEGLSLGAPLYETWVVWAVTESIADSYPNSTDARTALDEVQANFTALEITHFSELQQNCSAVGDYVWGSKALTTRRRSGANSLKHLDPDVAPAMRYFVERQRQPLAPSYDNETGQLVEPDQYGIALVAVINSTLVNLDVSTNAATMSFELRTVSYSDGDVQVVDERGRISAPGVTVKSDGDVRLVVVEPVPPLAACLAANVQQYSVPGLTHASVVNAGCTSPDKSGRPALLSFNPGYTLLSTADRFSGQELDVMAAGLQRYTGREDRSELEGVVQSHLAGPEVREVAAAMACLSQVLEAERRPGLELQQIDLLKIDAVKSEWDILQGISDTDWARVRQAVIEVHLGGDVSRLDKVVNLLKAKGFANVRTGWPGTPTFLAYKQYGMMKASASARDAAALAASVTAPTDGAGKQGAGKEGAGKEGAGREGVAAGAGAAPPLELPALPPPPPPSADEHLLCAVYATRS